MKRNDLLCLYLGDLCKKLKGLTQKNQIHCRTHPMMDHLKNHSIWVFSIIHKLLLNSQVIPYHMMLDLGIFLIIIIFFLKNLLNHVTMCFLILSVYVLGDFTLILELSKSLCVQTLSEMRPKQWWKLYSFLLVCTSKCSCE